MNHTEHYKSSPVQSIDFEPILVKLCHPTRGSNWSMERAEKSIELYKQWLYLHIVFPGENFSPSQEIDYVWHAHILDNRKYEQDCQVMFGQTLYHNPYAGMLGAEDEAAQQLRFNSTQARMSECFPESASAISGRPLCDSGYCDDFMPPDPIVRPTKAVLSEVA